MGAPCEACGHAFDMLATNCPRCAFPRGGASPELALRAGGKSARTAWWLSLGWPGAGHLYARDTEKGAIFCGVAALICLLSATVIGPTLGVIVWLALSLYTALDAGRAVAALASGSRAR